MSTGIPTNIIGGFLGAGKTTAIRHLLKHKPSQERWAVLVNEFGEIGVDGALLEAREQGIFVREVAGGCMCCTAGLSMQIALNMLIAQAQPQRILIEPTGLGHPLEIIATLNAPHYADTVQLKACFGLIDAQQLSLAQRYQPKLFMQQLAAADIVFASKSDLYITEHKQQLVSFLQSAGLDTKPLHFIQRGQIAQSLLDTNHKPLTQLPEITTPQPSMTLPPQPFPESGYIRKANHQDNIFSCGWIFSREYIFNYQALTEFFNQAPWLRIKACFNTERGMFGFNHSQGQYQQLNIQPQEVSKVEIIATQQTDWEQIEQQLQHCIYTRL